MKNKKDINYNDLSIDDIKKELNKEKYKNSFSKILINTLFVLIIILAIGSIITTIFMPVIEVSDSSMKPLINDGDIILTYKTNKFKQGDVVAFYHGNKILIKRVIGASGDFVNIDVNGNVFVNGSLIQEDYVKELKKGDTNVSFPIQVTASSIFVLSDERDNTFDSRIEEIGSVKESDIIGKVILKIYPINNIKFI